MPLIIVSRMAVADRFYRVAPDPEAADVWQVALGDIPAASSETFCGMSPVAVC